MMSAQVKMHRHLQIPHLHSPEAKLELVIKSPAFNRGSGHILPSSADKFRGSKVKILTEKNLVNNCSLIPVNPEQQNQ